jgi:release factor glutamine methyltransferase
VSVVAAGTIGAALDAAAASLARAGVDSPRLDARVLLAHALGEPPDAIRLRAGAALAPAARARFDALLARRAAREPVAYIVGHKEFWSLRFAVSPAVLIPRPDSETLIEAALALFPARDARLRVADLGTGSGCLLLAFLHERPRATGVGIDASAAALAIAAANAAALGLAARAAFRHADWADGVGERFELVLCNPPYIPQSEIAGLAPDVRDHEPGTALAAGADGLDAFRVLARCLPAALAADGMALIEVGAGQADQAESCLIRSGLRAVSRRRDLAGVERCLILGRHAR